MTTSQSIPRIVKLEESVINRIAAGEVVQRPANAIKELLENSLDAGSTNVQIIIKQGGLKLLQIQDNGHGIAESDMPLVCERFTTSKLRKFEDLTQIATFGFRGEALASISHVARVTITTKTANSQCAYKANYLDGKMSSELTFCAGNTGTQILAEDLFYNMTTRRNALQNFAEETRRICEVVQKYAVHNCKVAISLRRFDENVPDVRTSGGANSQLVDAIRNVYGNEVAKNFLPEMTIEDVKFAFTARCLCSSPNYAGKKFTLLLFINNRLVEHANLKRTIEQIYSVYLPKSASPFVYISLAIAPQNIDVNVHPTKQQVHFLFEDEIIEMIKRTVDSSLASSNSSRAFKVDTFAAQSPGLTLLAEEPPKKRQMASSFIVNPSPSNRPSSTSSTPAQHSIIRVDSAQQKLDRFFNTKQPGRTSLSASPAATLMEMFGRPGSSTSASISLIEDSGISVTQQSETSTPDPGQAMALEKLNEDVSFYVKPKKMSENGRKEQEKSDKDDEIDDELLNSAYDLTQEGSSAQTSELGIVAMDVEENGKTFEGTEKTAIRPSGKIAAVQPPIIPKASSVAKVLPEVSVKVTTAPPSRTVSSANLVSDRTFRKRNIQLDSIKLLRQEVENNCHDGLTRILSNFTFVGCIDYNNSLIQHEARLLMLDNAKVSAEFFYQAVLTNFGNMGFIRFNEPISIEELALIALDSPHSCWKEADGPKQELATFGRDFLVSKAGMLLDYFSIEIEPETGFLAALPLIIPDYLPNFAKLPFFVLRLASDVNWDSEKECFHTICLEIAKFYAAGEMPPMTPGPENDRQNDGDFKKQLEHALFLQIRQQISSTFFPPKQLSESAAVVEITSLHELYKVFERC